MWDQFLIYEITQLTKTSTQTTRQEVAGEDGVCVDRHSWRMADDLTWASSVDLRTSTDIPRT